MQNNYHKDNKFYWDELAVLHAGESDYDVTHYHPDTYKLRNLDRELLGNIRGKRILHLQCHIGLDSIALEKMGANVVAVDYSHAAIDVALAFKDKFKLALHFICADITDLSRCHLKSFDIIYTSYGVLVWLENLTAWANNIASHLRAGGEFIIIDEHPFSKLFCHRETDNAAFNSGKLNRYWNDKKPVDTCYQFSYACEDKKLNNQHQHIWIHPLSDIINALLMYNLEILHFNEYDKSFFRVFPEMICGNDNWWQFMDDKTSIPLTFSLKAKKKGLSQRQLILGVNLPVLPDGSITFDGNVALADERHIIMALAEERVSKKKYDGGVSQAINEILKRNNISLNDLAAISVVSFGQPALKNNEASRVLCNEIDRLFPGQNKIHLVRSHHEAHALTAATQCPFERALVIVADHTGNLLGERLTDSEVLENNPAEQTSYYLYENGRLTLIAQDHTLAQDEGYGRFYGDITCYLGFSSYRESGKTMGLSSFGDAGFFASVNAYTADQEGKEVTSLQEVDVVEDNIKDLRCWFARQGITLARRRLETEIIRPFDMHLAAWAQDQLQTSLIRRVAGLITKYHIPALCVTGGVAMNSVLNYNLEKAFQIPVFVPPSPGDAGLAIGACADYLQTQHGDVPRFKASAWLGPEYSGEEIKEAVYAVKDKFFITETADPSADAAELIARGEVIGWFQGRSEYGPRALGNRSILASPSNSWMKERLNSQIKRREWFRPYAPVVLESEAHLYFHSLSPVPYMMKVAPVTERARREISACIHVDGSARLQTVTKEANPLFCLLIEKLKEITGTPVVLNTSFNLAGMPIVETAGDAIKCVLDATGINYLVISNFIMKKKTCL